jgi:hypothetical protein
MMVTCLDFLKNGFDFKAFDFDFGFKAFYVLKNLALRSIIAGLIGVWSVECGVKLQNQRKNNSSLLIPHS